MRMWMINCKLLCDQHLLGEHSEHHKYRTSFERGHRIDKRVSNPPQIFPLRMQERHDEIAMEMLCRGMNHQSPYMQPDLSKLQLKSSGLTYLDHYPNLTELRPDVQYNLKDLCSRCPDCRERILKHIGVNMTKAQMIRKVERLQERDQRRKENRRTNAQKLSDYLCQFYEKHEPIKCVKTVVTAPHCPNQTRTKVCHTDAEIQNFMVGKVVV